jgi:hypothetical protein
MPPGTEYMTPSLVFLKNKTALGLIRKDTIEKADIKQTQDFLIMLIILL